MRKVSEKNTAEFRKISLLSTMRFLSHQLRDAHDSRMALLALLAPSRLSAEERQEVLSSLRADSLDPVSSSFPDKAAHALFGGTDTCVSAISPTKAIQDVWDLCVPYFPVWGKHQLENIQYLRRIQANRSMFYALVLNLLLEVRAICKVGGDICLSGMPCDAGISFSLIVSAPEFVETDWLQAVLAPEELGGLEYEAEVRILFTALETLGAEIRAERKTGAPVVGTAAEEYVPEMLVLHVTLPEEMAPQKTKRAAVSRQRDRQAPAR